MTAPYQQIGIGTYKIQDDTCIDIVREGLNIGYKLIDTAQLYKNHTQVAEGIKQSNINRSEIFITSKIHNRNIKSVNIAKAIDEIKKELDTDYIDLILLHNPVKNYDLAYAELIRCQNQQNILNIGVSNFMEDHLININNKTGINPFLNQIELNILNCKQRQNLISYHKQNDILTQSHSNIKTHMNSGELIKVPEEILSKYNITSIEYLLAYPIKQSIGIIPGTSNINHLRSNYELYNKIMTEEKYNDIVY